MPNPLRDVTGFCLLAVLSTVPAWLQAADAPATHTLRSSRATGVVDHVEAALDMGGDQKTTVDNKAQRHKTSVQATLVYDEKTLEYASAPTGSIRGLRAYEKASAVVQVGQDGVKPKLRDDRTVLGVLIDVPKVTLFSPSGPLTREELDLVDLLGNSLLLDRLLPEKPVAIGESWKHSNDLIGSLLGLDAVAKTEVESKLVSVADGAARLEISGHVEGAVGGVSTSLEIKGKYRFLMGPGRIDWFGMLVKEDRSIGHIGPGLEVTARVQLKITPQAQSAALSGEAAKDFPQGPSTDVLSLSYRSPGGGWQLLHDRGWFVVHEQQDVAVLRLVDRGELVAQCNVSPLAKLAPSKVPGLEEYQEDVKRVLGKNVKKIVEAGQRTGDQEYRIYRVVAEGDVEDLPIRWVYYLVADKQGRQLAFVFTVETKLVEQFKQADEKLVDAVRILGAKSIVEKPADK